jgi:hypothetical protein
MIVRGRPRKTAVHSTALAAQLLLLCLAACSADRPPWATLTPSSIAAGQAHRSTAGGLLSGNSEQQQQRRRCDEWWAAWLRPASRMRLGSGQQQEADAAGAGAAELQMLDTGFHLQRRALGEVPIPHIIHQV